MSFLHKKQVFADDLSPQERSTVKMVYRRYYRGKWYESDTPKEGYNIISYYATKVKTRLYHSDIEDAQADRDKYNKRLAAYKQGRNKLADYDLVPDDKIPQSKTWASMPSTIRNPLYWPHNNASDDDLSWLYEHADDYSEAWDNWKLRELLKEETKEGMDESYASGNTTRKFFNLIFSNDTSFAGFDLYWSKGDNRWYAIAPV